MLRTTKPPRCKVCRIRLDQHRPGQVVHLACVEEHVRRLRAKKAQTLAKKEREIHRKAKEGMKTLAKWEDECRKIVQKIARIRDRHLGCISCEKPANWDGQWHGSHFRSVGACSALSLHLWNINRACWICNKLYSGRIDQYELGLIERYGQERVDWLRSQSQIVRRDVDYYKRFKAVMGKRLRRMEKRIQE